MMIRWLKFLGKPLGYLSIKYGSKKSSKRSIDLVLPAYLTFILILLAVFFGNNAPWFSDDGVLGIRRLLTLTFPFYIAALTAVAAANSNHLDHPFKTYDNPHSPERIKGNFYTEVWNNDAQKNDYDILTRRQFLIALFGHLAFISFSLLIIIIVNDLFNLRLNHLTTDQVSVIIYSSANLAFLFALSHLICTTFYALVFLNLSVYKKTQ